MRAKKKSPYHKDILGQRFGRLTVIADGGNDKRQSRYWLCRCDCGTEKIILGHALRQGATKSCGCLQRAEVQIAPGMKLTRLTVLASAGKDKHYSKRWLCRCDCGTEKVIGNLALQNGTTQSCGCLQKERTAELATPRLVAAAKKRTIAYRRERGWPEDVPITPINNAQRTIFSQTVAKAIRVRDNFKCGLCGECAGVVHHIKPWARQEELRFEPLNLVTLCKACHVDKAHAGKPNTKTDSVVAGYLTAYVANHHNEKEWRDILAYIQSMPVKTPEERKQARREYMKVRNAQPEIRARAIENQRKRWAANRERYNASG
jgi:5-methylcytosine-specific restriction endonuclease McrA